MSVPISWNEVKIESVGSYGMQIWIPSPPAPANVVKAEIDYPYDPVLRLTLKSALKLREELDREIAGMERRINIRKDLARREEWNYSVIRGVENR